MMQIHRLNVIKSRKRNHSKYNVSLVSVWIWMCACFAIGWLIQWDIYYIHGKFNIQSVYSFREYYSRLYNIITFATHKMVRKKIIRKNMVFGDMRHFSFSSLSFPLTFFHSRFTRSFISISKYSTNCTWISYRYRSSFWSSISIDDDKHFISIRFYMYWRIGI